MAGHRTSYAKNRKAPSSLERTDHLTNQIQPALLGGALEPSYFTANHLEHFANHFFFSSQACKEFRLKMVLQGLPETVLGLQRFSTAAAGLPQRQDGSLLCGPVICAIGDFAIALVSTHLMPVALLPTVTSSKHLILSCPHPCAPEDHSHTITLSSFPGCNLLGGS